MFLVMGITEGRKDLEYGHLITCGLCGAYGRFNVFMTYTVFSLFFIPCFKWNKHYYVQTSCCNTLYELDPEIGKQIGRGEDVEIRQEDLTRVMNGRTSAIKVCQNCGYMTDEDFEFCPKCGNRF